MLRSLVHRTALFTALLGACGQLFGIAHLLLVPHTVCAEHGELVHAASAHRHEHAVARSAAAAVRSADSEVGHVADTHDHCASTVTRKDSLAVFAARASLVSACANQVAARLETSLAPPSARQRLLYAPKSSPPAQRA